jgi:E3 ubiquitin-protein ligase SHPRH
MLLADRREVLSAERTILAVHDARERKLRKTAAAKANTAKTETGEPDAELLTEVVELQPEHEVLQGELDAYTQSSAREIHGTGCEIYLGRPDGSSCKDHQR